MTPQTILDTALAQAQASPPEVRAFAHLHIARILVRFHPEAARTLLIEALVEIDSLPLDRHRSSIDREAYLLATATAPDLAAVRPLPAGPFPTQPSVNDIVRVLLDHGYMKEAAARVLNFYHPASFPYAAASTVAARASDPELTAILIRRSVQAWLQHHPLHESEIKPQDRAAQSAFRHFFLHHWDLVPEEDARSVIREFVRMTIESLDHPTDSRLGSDGKVRFTSWREVTLFHTLHVLRSLDPPLAESLISTHPQIAAAAREFPLGIQSFLQARQRDIPPADQAGRKPGYVIGGSDQDIAFGKSLLQAQDSGDFSDPFQLVLDSYEQDLASNAAFRELWPSVQTARTLFYQVGKTLGLPGALHLDNLPDPDLRLFSQIEFAAGLAGLPPYSGVSVQSPRRATSSATGL